MFHAQRRAYSPMKTDHILLGLFLLFLAYVLIRNPKCNRGCKTLAEHLFTDGLEDVVGGLFA